MFLLKLKIADENVFYFYGRFHDHLTFHINTQPTFNTQNSVT